MQYELCQHCRRSPVTGLCSRCQKAGFCSHECLQLAIASNASNIHRGCVPFGVDGAAATAVLPSPARSMEEERRALELKMRVAREAFRRRERVARARIEMLNDFREGFVARERALTRGMLAEIDAWAVEMDTTLTADERPRDWDVQRVTESVRLISARAAAAGASWRTPAEVQRHLDGLEGTLTRFQQLVGVPEDPQQPPRAEMLTALVTTLARDIVKESAVRAEEYVRDDDESGEEAAPAAIAVHLFGWPPEDVASQTRPPRRRADYQAHERLVDSQLEAAQRFLATDAERSFFRQLLERFTGPLEELPARLRVWARVHAKSVAYGLLIMTITGVVLWVGGKLALLTLQRSHEDIAASIENVAAVATAQQQSVAAVEAQLAGLQDTIASTAGAVRGSLEIWKEIQTELPPNEQGITAMAHALAQFQVTGVAAFIKERGKTREQAVESFNSVFGASLETFSKLRADYFDNKIDREEWGSQWRDFQYWIRWAFVETRQFTIDQLMLMRESVNALNEKLRGIGASMATLVDEAEKLRRAEATVLSEEAVYFAKAPFSAYIMRKLGEAYGAGAGVGSMIFYTSNELLKLQEMESYVRVLTGGVDELLVNGIASFMTNAVVLAAFQRTTVVLATALGTSARLVAGLIRLGRRMGALVARFRTPLPDAPEGLSVPSWWAQAEDWINARATDVENAQAFVGVATNLLRTGTNLLSIAVSVARLLAMLVAWCSAWWLGVALVVGIALYVVVTKVLAISSRSVAGYVARMLLGYHWVLAPALGVLVNIFSVAQGYEAPSLIGESPEVIESRVEQTSRWQQLADIADRRKTNKTLQDVFAAAADADLQTARAQLASETLWVFRTV